MDPLPINDAIVIPASDLVWTAARAGGPGGQNVNKVSSKVELRFDLARTAVIPPDALTRLRALAAGRIDRDGVLLITSQRTRDQPRNLDDAREKLRALVLRALEVPTVRKATKPSRGAQRRRLNDKAHTGAVKRARTTRPDSDD